MINKTPSLAYLFTNLAIKQEDIHKQKSEEILSEIQENARKLGIANDLVDEILKKSDISTKKLDFSNCDKAKELINHLRKEGVLDYKDKKEYIFEGSEIATLNHKLSAYKDKLSQDSSLNMTKLQPILELMTEILKIVSKANTDEFDGTKKIIGRWSQH
jgi:hypothetical protein